MAAPTSLDRSQTAIHVPTQRSLNSVPISIQDYNLPKSEYDAVPFRLTQKTSRKNPPYRASKGKPEVIMSPVAQPEGQVTGSQAAIDPISRQILERTHSQNRVTQLQNTQPPTYSVSGSPEDPKPLPRTNTNADQESLRRVDTTASSKLTKDKKKGVSFLSRIMGGKKREDDDVTDFRDNASEIIENRPLGTDVEVFSQPIGFIPKFPAPPRYIRVKAYNRKKRDFDRLFLAQILSGSQTSRKERSSIDFDSKIHNINEKPVLPPPNSSKTVNNAVWASEFSKDGQYFAVGGQDKKLRVWQVISTKEDREREEAASSDSGDGNEPHVKLNAPVFKHELVREYDGHTSAILDLSWSKNNFLLSSSMDKTVRLYHISRPECLCAFKHNDFVTSIQFHPRDDRFFLAGSLDSKIRLWSIPDKNVAYMAPVQDMVTAVAFTPDGKTAIAGTLSGLCILYEVEGLKAHSQIHVRSNRGKNAKGSKITGIDTTSVPRQYGANDIKILITSNDSRIRIYNLRDRSLEAKYRGNENLSSQIRATFSDDGKFVICGSEDKRVYIWPTGPSERPDLDKRPLEVYEAHSSIVTTAVLAPTATRRLLAQSGDPLYDLCNPPPVRLFSRADSVISSKAPTQHSGSDERPVTQSPRKSESPPPAVDESPQYLSRHSHNGGQIIVTADYCGQIKVFRHDCAYQKRREGSLDTVSSLSKRIRGRSGSLATKNSGSSVSNRHSMTFNSKNPSTDRILNWRNSVVSAKSASAATSVSDINLRSSIHTRDRSVSPDKRNLAHRFSLRHGNTPLATPSNGSVSSSRRNSRAQPPENHIESAVQNPGSPNYYSASEHRQSSATHTSTENPPKFALNDDVLSSPETENMSQPTPGDGFAQNFDDEENPLHLVGSQSYLAWDIRNTLLPMANASARTPGPLPGNGRNPLSREESFASQLSSERLSSGPRTPSAEDGAHEDPDETITERNHRQRDSEQLKCKRCGSESFKLYRMENGDTAMRCQNCHAPM